MNWTMTRRVLTGSAGTSKRDSMMTQKQSKRRWMPIVLAISLGLNLAVVAAVAGAAWRHKGPGDGGPRGAKGGGTIYLQALPQEARRAVLGQLRSTRGPSFDATPMIDALRKEPFDAEAAGRALDARRDRGLARSEAGNEALLGHIATMSAQERAAYADRIEEISERRKAKRKKKRDD